MTLRERTVNERVASILDGKKTTRVNPLKTTAKSGGLINPPTRKVTAPSSVTVKSAFLPTVQQGKFSLCRHFLIDCLIDCLGLPFFSIVIVKNETKENSLKREDSNLSQKSLTKLKAALTKDQTKKNTFVTARPKVEAKLKQEVQSVKVKPEVTSRPKVVTKLIPTVKTTSHSTQLFKHVENIDARDTKNPILVSEYVNDIYEYLRQLESDQQVNENFLEGQEVRSYLVFFS